MICPMRRGNYHHKCSTMRFFHLLPRKESFLSISISYKYLGNEYYPVTFYCTINIAFLGSIFITLMAFFFLAPQKNVNPWCNQRIICVKLRILYFVWLVNMTLLVEAVTALFWMQKHFYDYINYYLKWAVYSDFFFLEAIYKLPN